MPLVLVMRTVQATTWPALATWVSGDLVATSVGLATVTFWLAVAV